MCAIRFECLTFLTKAQLAVGLDGEGGGRGRVVCWQRRIAVVVRRAAGFGKDSLGIAPVEHKIEEDAEKRRGFACIALFNPVSKWIDGIRDRRTTIKG